jgi:hypothetical protein
MRKIRRGRRRKRKEKEKEEEEKEGRRKRRRGRRRRKRKRRRGRRKRMRKRRRGRRIRKERRRRKGFVFFVDIKPSGILVSLHRYVATVMVNVKFTPEQATKAQRWSRGKAVLFL